MKNDHHHDPIRRQPLPTKPELETSSQLYTVLRCCLAPEHLLVRIPRISRFRTASLEPQQSVLLAAFREGLLTESESEVQRESFSGFWPLHYQVLA
jgi:hypothetical protein